MTKLYGKWAWVYREMYESIFDYRKDFLRFKRILDRHGLRGMSYGCF